MYQLNDKKRLYQLSHMYLDGRITASIFCDEFYNSYCLEINEDDLDDLEKQKIKELDIVAGRFSPYKED